MFYNLYLKSIDVYVAGIRLITYIDKKKSWKTRLWSTIEN